METEGHIKQSDGGFDDSPYAETRQRRAAYDANLRQQRSNLAKEDNKPSAANQPLPRAERSKYAHEGHKLFGKFYTSMNYDARTEFLHKSPAEKEQIFLQWLADRQK